MVMPLEQQKVLLHKSQTTRREEPLRVLLLNYEYPPLGGGAGNATRNTALELTRRGHRVHVLTSRQSEQSDVGTEAGLVVHRVRSTRVNIHQAGLWGAVSFLLRAFFRLRRLAAMHNYEIYHFYFGLPTGLLAIYVHCVLKKPYVLALRGSDVPGYDNTRTYLRPLHWCLSPLTRFLWTRAAKVTALSNNLRELAQASVPGIPIEVIGNGVEASVFPARPAPRFRKNLRLVCVCRLERRKGLTYLIEAMRELSKDNVTLDIVGKGQREVQLRKLIERYSLENAVRLIGYVPQNNLEEHYKAADVFILPSLSESFGQALIEAMCSGLPVIASRAGGIPETLDDGIGGVLIEPASSEAIVRAVRQLAADRSSLETMGRHNHRKAVQHYNWSGIASQYESLYRSILGDESISAVRPE